MRVSPALTASALAILQHSREVSSTPFAGKSDDTSVTSLKSRSAAGSEDSSRNPTYYVLNDLRRSDLDERDGCAGKLECTDLSVCCALGTTCCSSWACCNPGYACYPDGYCYADNVYTVYLTSTTYRYSTYFTTDYETITSTYWSTTTDYTTVTQHSKNGVATETEWTTVTQVVKRGGSAVPTETGPAQATQTPPIPEPTSPPRMAMELRSRDLGIRRVFEDMGLLEKRVSTAYITVWSTSTVYSYVPGYTSYNYDYITSFKGSTVTRTSVIFDGASTTVTVTSTETVQSHKDDPTPTDPGPQNTTPIQTTPEPTPTTPTEPISVTVTLTPTWTSSISGSMVVATSYSSGVAIIYPVEEPTATSTGPASPSQTGHGSGGLSTGAKIGIGVGAGAGGILLLVLIALAIWRMRKSRSAHDQSQPTSGWDMVDATRLSSPPPAPPVPVVYTAYHEKEPTSPGPSIATTAVASTIPQYPSQHELHGQSHIRSVGSTQELESYPQSYRTVSPMQELYGSPTSLSELGHENLTQPTQVYHPPAPYHPGARGPGWN